MRIALVTDGLFPDVIGGMQKHSFFLAKFLAQKGVRVDLYYTAPSANDNAAFGNFTAEESELIQPIYTPFPQMGNLPGHYIKESLKYSMQVYEKFGAGEKVDLIYAQGFTGWYFCDQRHRNRLKTPVVINLHGLEMFQPTFGLVAVLQRFLLRSPAKFMLKRADGVYSLGGKLTQLLREVPVAEERILVQSIGIDTSWLIPQVKNVRDQKRKFVFVGRYEKRKGLDVLNAIMADNQAADCEFHLVGPIQGAKQVEAPNVFYHGAIKEEDDIKSLLDECHVLVCPSYAEGMPTVILEAMSRGLAVIATDVGAVSELVNSQTGWLIRPGSHDELGAAVNLAIAGEHLDDKRHAARQLIEEHFTWNKVVEDTLAGLYQKELIAKPTMQS